MFMRSASAFHLLFIYREAGGSIQKAHISSWSSSGLLIKRWKLLYRSRRSSSTRLLEKRSGTNLLSDSRTYGKIREGLRHDNEVSIEEWFFTPHSSHSSLSQYLSGMNAKASITSCQNSNRWMLHDCESQRKGWPILLFIIGFSTW